jgi:hypothetical protein
MRGAERRGLVIDDVVHLSRRALAGVIIAGAVAGFGSGAPAAVFAVGRLPPPAFARSVDIGLVSGTVIVTPPNRLSFTLGAQDRNIPIGSLIDTAHGRVDLRSAPPPAAGGGTARATVEDAQFYDGSFRVTQSPAVPVAQIRLAGGDIRTCSAPGGQLTPRRALPHRVLRLLNASGPGRFETVGRFAAATVRGTVWLTEDYCDGTLVRVRAGVVSVEDLVTHATVTVGAGHSFFARAPAG